MSTATQTGREGRAARKAERALERDYDRLRTDVVGALRGKLVAANVRVDDGDLEVAYNLAWHVLYEKLKGGETIENPGGFLTQVAFFRAMDDFRAQRPGRRGDVDLDAAGGVEPDVDGHLDDRDQLRAFTEGLGQRLDGRERQAAVLCYLHGYSRPEAAALIGVPAPRMEKIMDGVSKVVRGLVADLKQGDWCESQKSLMTAYALGVLAPEGQRRAMASAHLDGCSGCRAHVRRLRGMGAMVPPFMLPWGAVGVNPLHLPAQILGGGHLVPAAPGAFATVAGGHGGAGVGAAGGHGGSGAGAAGGHGGTGAGGSGGWGTGGPSGAGTPGSGGNGPKVAVGVAALLLLLGGVALAADGGSESPTAAGYGESAAGGVLASSPTAAGYGESSASGVLAGGATTPAEGRSADDAPATGSGDAGVDGPVDGVLASAPAAADPSGDAATAASDTGTVRSDSAADPSVDGVAATSPTASGYGETSATGVLGTTEAVADAPTGTDDATTGVDRSVTGVRGTTDAAADPAAGVGSGSATDPAGGVLATSPTASGYGETSAAGVLGDTTTAGDPTGDAGGSSADPTGADDGLLAASPTASGYGESPALGVLASSRAAEVSPASAPDRSWTVGSFATPIIALGPVTVHGVAGGVHRSGATLASSVLVRRSAQAPSATVVAAALRTP